MTTRKKIITIKQRLYLSLVGVFLLILLFGVANLLHLKFSVANLITFDQPVTPQIVHTLLQEHTNFIFISLILILVKRIRIISA